MHILKKSSRLFRLKLSQVGVKRYTGFEGSGWRKDVPPLRTGYYFVTNQSVTGDAPKNFIHVYEYGQCSRIRPRTWPAYIAKVGHKWYPAESVTEQMMTRIGQSFNFNLAESRLMRFSDQIRFLSRYFLKRDESLVHGAEIIGGYLEDIKFVAEVGKLREEKEHFSFRFFCDAIRSLFGECAAEIIRDFIRLIAFDALVGNQDRHLYNWGVIVHPRGLYRPRFSPIFDTARGLFWNVGESGLEKFGTPQRLKRYMEDARPLIGWEDNASLNHFELLHRILELHPEARLDLARFVTREGLKKAHQASLNQCTPRRA